jgi:hypothetical protein
MCAIGPSERLRDSFERGCLIWIGAWCWDRDWLSPQPCADSSEIVLGQIIEVDAANRAHRITVFHVLRKLV